MFLFCFAETNLEATNEVHTQKMDSSLVEFIVINHNFVSILSKFDCGPSNCEINFQSRFMKKHKQSMKMFPLLQQQLLDYCFSKDSNRDEWYDNFLTFIALNCNLYYKMYAY